MNTRDKYRKLCRVYGKAQGLPRFVKWDKRFWSFGWWQDDSHCVWRSCPTWEHQIQALSPTCCTRLQSVLAFLATRYLLRVDRGLQ